MHSAARPPNLGAECDSGVADVPNLLITVATESSAVTAWSNALHLGTAAGSDGMDGVQATGGDGGAAGAIGTGGDGGAAGAIGTGGTGGTGGDARVPVRSAASAARAVTAAARHPAGLA